MGSSHSHPGTRSSSNNRAEWSTSLPHDTTSHQDRLKQHHTRAIKKPAQPEKVRVLPVGPLPNGAAKLRLTDNGNILQSGGTLSGRRKLELEAASIQHEQELLSWLQRKEEDARARGYESEPEIARYRGHKENRPSEKCSSPIRQTIIRSRKKYKAPAPPPEESTKKARLFKTKAETRRALERPTSASSSAQVNGSIPRARSMDSLHHLSRSSNHHHHHHHQDTRPDSSTPTDDIMDTCEGQLNSKAKSSGMKEPVRNPQLVNSLNQIFSEKAVKPADPPKPKQIKPTFYFGMEPCDEKRSRQQKQQPNGIHQKPVERQPQQQQQQQSTPLRDVRTAATEEIKRKNSLEDFAARLENWQRRNVTSYDSPNHLDSGNYHTGDSSSLDEEEEDVSVVLHLRPSLPQRKQKIPRFSPKAAWKSLSVEHLLHQQQQAYSPDCSDDGDMYDSHIQRMTRPVAPVRGQHEKSGDSGISGDAGSPAPIFELAVPPPLAVSSPIPQLQPKQNTWTPEQDLDLSSNESLNIIGHAGRLPSGMQTPPKFTSRANMFSLPSQHSDEYQSLYKKAKWNKSSSSRKENHHHVDGQNSLRRLKRSMSNALSALGNNTNNDNVSNNMNGTKRSPLLDGNWYMSRSVPNFLNSKDLEIGPTTVLKDEFVGTLTMQPVSEAFDEKVFLSREVQSDIGISADYNKRLAYSRRQHIMYLPSYDSRPPLQRPNSMEALHHQLDETPNKSRNKSKAVEELRSQSPYLRSQSAPLYSQDTPKKSGKKKFTFQSTIRQRERKKLEENLNRENEKREKQRLREIEAMRKVEEEFQRKRMKEKANIRQQLRLYSLESNNNQSFSSDNTAIHDESISSDERFCFNPKVGGRVSSSSSNRKWDAHPNHGDVPMSLPAIIAGNTEPYGNNRGSTSPDSDGSKYRRVRQEPDGAPDSKMTPEEIRQRVVSAARMRNGHVQEPRRRPYSPGLTSLTSTTVQSDSSYEPKKKSVYKQLAELVKREEEIRQKDWRKQQILNGNSDSDSERHLKCDGMSQTLTHEISEYKEERREYKDYYQRGGQFTDVPGRCNSPRFVETPTLTTYSDDGKKSTIHPEAVFDIPMKQHVFVVNNRQQLPPAMNFESQGRRPEVVGENYRRDFAHGSVLNHANCSSRGGSET